MIKLLNSYFNSNDKRGEFIGINNKYKWEEINFINSKKESIRGGHYHKETLELFFIISGKIEITYKKVISYNRYGQTERIIVSKNDIFIIEKNTYHEFYMIEESSWINALTKKHNIENPDFFKK